MEGGVRADIGAVCSTHPRDPVLGPLLDAPTRPCLCSRVLQKNATRTTYHPRDGASPDRPGPFADPRLRPLAPTRTRRGPPTSRHRSMWKGPTDMAGPAALYTAEALSTPCGGSLHRVGSLYTAEVVSTPCGGSQHRGGSLYTVWGFSTPCRLSLHRGGSLYTVWGFSTPRRFEN